MGTAERAEYDKRLARDIAARLRNACAHLSPAKFDALVADLVAMRARFRDIDRNPTLWRSTQDHPAAVRTDERDGPVVHLPRMARRRDD